MVNTGILIIYTLWETHIAMENHVAFSTGKSTTNGNISEKPISRFAVEAGLQTVFVAYS